MSQTNTNVSPPQPENANGRSKPRTIIRLLSTKFTPRAASAPSVRSPPPQPQQSANAREQREAALRAVGLLPPLRANKDLSLQEMEQDTRIPIVPLAGVSGRPSESSSTDPAATADVQPSAADLIKKEWERKHRETGTVPDIESSQREKMNTFGGSSPSLVVPLQSSDLASAPADAAEGSLSPKCPDQVVTPPVQNPLSSPPDFSGPTSSSRETPTQSTTNLAPIPSRSQITSPMDSTSPPPSPYMIPLPLSAKPSYSSLRSKCSAPSSPPPNRELPPLPQTPTVPEMSLSASLQVAVSSVADSDTPHSISIPSGGEGGETGSSSGLGAGSGTSTPRPSAAPALPSSLPTTESPANSATPQAKSDDALVSVSGETTSLATPVPAPPPVKEEEEEELAVVENAVNDSDDCSGSNVFSPESISSVKTPSLDSSSQTTTSDSSSADVSPSVRPQLLAPGKAGSLHVKTAGAERVPAVVIASPIELHRFSEELDVVIEDDGEAPVEDLDIEKLGLNTKAAESASTNLEDEEGEGEGEGGKGTQTPKAPVTSTNPASAPSTTLTFPTTPLKPEADETSPTSAKKSLMNRRKTLNPFKRAQTLGAGSVKPQAQPNPTEQAASANEPRRRLTVGTSLSNIRRSVVGSLSSKSRSSASTVSSGSTTGSSANGKEKMFDASHLPASPTIPSSFVGSVGSRGSGGSGGGAGHLRMTPPPTPTRLARPVVIHTGGSILEQTQGIEDAETRRMTELAFM